MELYDGGDVERLVSELLLADELESAGPSAGLCGFVFMLLLFEPVVASFHSRFWWQAGLVIHMRMRALLQALVNACLAFRHQYSLLSLSGIARTRWFLLHSSHITTLKGMI